MKTGTTIQENSLAVPCKINIYLPIRASNLTPRCISKNETYVHKTPVYIVNHSFICNTPPKPETTQVSFKGWVNSSTSHNEILLNNKND